MEDAPTSVTETERTPLVVRLAANTAVQAGGTLLSSFVSLFTFAAVTRYLGPGAFGDLAAATAFLFIPSVLADVGLAAAVLREISKRPETTERTLNVSLPLRAAVAATVLVVSVALSYTLPLDDRTHTAILIGSIGAFLTLLNLGLVPVLQARLQMHHAAFATLVGRIVTLVLTLAVLAAGLGFAAIVWSSVAGAAVTLLLIVIAVRRIVSLRPAIDLRAWRWLLRTSIALGLAIGIAQIYFRIDTLILAVLKSAEEVGLYAASYKLIEFAQVIGGAVGLSVFPSLALFAEDAADRAGRLAQKTFDLLVAAGFAFMIPMLTVPAELLNVLAGDDFRPAADAVQLLAPYALLSFIASLYWWLFVSIGQDRLLVGASCLLLALNVGLNFAFIPRFGFEAAAAISTISECASLAVMVILGVRRNAFRPDLRYSGFIAAAAGVMAILTIVLPGPPLLAAAIAGAVYCGILLVAPGTIRTAAADIAAGTRGALAR